VTREIVMDTETTGLDPAQGDRLVEIGAVELLNYLPTGRTFHRYINPERDVPAEAVAVHGLTADFLKQHPVFADVAQDFLEFIGDAPLIIHNASFDIGFLNAELSYLEKPPLAWGRVTDTLKLARDKFPMAQASLDALCRRFGIDNSKRTKHGALLDSELLAEVYLELIGGRQTALTLSTAPKPKAFQSTPSQKRTLLRTVPLASRLTEDERSQHQLHVKELGPDSMWLRYSERN
jgi:DNA polymerase III subunit epsilon